jgi:dihydroorotase
MLTRRDFSKNLLTGGAALLASDSLWPEAAIHQSSNQECDLLIKGGTVIDPGQRMHALMDVAVKDGKILEVSRDFSEKRAQKVISAKGRIVTPGFIDMHAHCFEGFGGMNADKYCLGRGVTTVVDAGSAGYLGIRAFIKFVVKTSVTRVFPLVNIGALGLITGGSVKKSSQDISKEFQNVMENPDWVYPQLTAKAALENKGPVLGIKVRLQQNVQGSRDLDCLKMALEAAEASHLPLMAHIDDTYSPLPDILKMMRKGDVFTHFYHGHAHGILDANGRIVPEVREARNRGVVMDPAPGGSHFSFDTAKKAMQQDFLPDTISTDLAESRALEFGLPNMVSQFLALGMDLDKAIERVTIKPAQVFDYGIKIGTLRPGYEADIGIFELQEGNFDFEDGAKKKFRGHQMLVNKGAVCRGRLFTNEA